MKDRKCSIFKSHWTPGCPAAALPINKSWPRGLAQGVVKAVLPGGSYMPMGDDLVSDQGQKEGLEETSRSCGLVGERLLCPTHVRVVIKAKRVWAQPEAAQNCPGTPITHVCREEDHSMKPLSESTGWVSLQNGNFRKSTDWGRTSVQPGWESEPLACLEMVGGEVCGDL